LAYSHQRLRSGEHYSASGNWRFGEDGPQQEARTPRLQSQPEISNTREGVIQEIFETEEEHLHLLHICMKMFVLPLRVQNSRSWIAGIPQSVARLLDWFDDIVNLHEQIYESLCLARDTMSPATDRVSESLRWFVLKIEVYQPYVVRVADVLQEIVNLTENTRSDLGQFIRLQQRSSGSQGWTFEKLLMLPINRLGSYQDLFAVGIVNYLSPVVVLTQFHISGCWI